MSTPPLPLPGMIRLYRGETAGVPDGPVPSWMENNPEFVETKAASGRWFSEQIEDAIYYCHHFGAGPDAPLNITWVDVPCEQLEQYRASNQPEAMRFSAAGMASNEFFLSRELADQRRPLPVSLGMPGPIAVGYPQQRRESDIHLDPPIG